ncbi:cell surface protein [Colletotrichum tofieldiae]|uniref:Cell surface protein n=1 Tax=Colletotrichum tofieldiae TaxID=708197 RepID=A0A161VXL9_9PEZI|nr:cell surface protein [Colletotrichum tofieldiae]GKT82225.1 cell surface protein [Colletotrichum tofieldiae]
MGLGSKIKNALHSDDHPQKSYEGEQPPGAFPTDSTTAANTKHNTPGTTGAHTGSHTTGGYSGGTTGAHTGSHTASNTATGYDDPDGIHGPHSRRALNKGDPRVDSDRDHRGAPSSGLTGTNTTHGHTSGSGLTGNNTTRGTHGTTTGSGVTGSNNPYSSNTTTGYDDPDGVHGPHGGRAANKIDPRVDSDRDHRGAPGSGLTGSNTYGTSTGVGRTGGLNSNPHGGATGGIAGNRTTGYDDPDGVHGPHGGRAANKIDPRVDSDRDHRGAPGAGLASTHRPTDSGVDVGHGPGHNKPYPGENLRNTQDPYWGDVGRDGHSVSGTHGTQAATGTLNKDLPLRPNESGVGRGGPQAVGGGTYNAAGTHHHDPASSVDRSMEGPDFTHPHQSGNVGVGGAGSDPYSGVHNAAHNPQAALAGGSSSDPYDTRMRDRDMGRERTGHGAAGAGIGAGVGAGAAMAAGQAAHRHHRDDMHEAGYGTGNTGAGGLSSGVGHNTTASHGISNTRGGIGSGIGSGVGGVDDHSHSSIGGNEPGVPRTSMLDPYNGSPTASGVRGNVAGGKGGHYGGRSGSPPFNQGMQNSNVPGNTGLGSSSMGPDHYGPGHEGAKVFHTCTRCGEDNDISRYFKKDAVYRMG